MGQFRREFAIVYDNNEIKNIFEILNFKDKHGMSVCYSGNADPEEENALPQFFPLTKLLLLEQYAPGRILHGYKICS